MYQQSPEERPGCRDVLVITREVFYVILPPLLAMLALLILIVLVLFAFAVTPALALLPLAGIIVGIVLFARRERRRSGGGKPRDF